MNKGYWLTSLLVFSMLGVTGCASNNRSGVNEQNDLARPIGYYSNENHYNKNGLYADNDGPLTELMDHTMGAEDQITDNQRKKMLQKRDANGNPPNPTVPEAANDQFLKKDNRFSTGDVNYHDHLSQNINNTGETTDSKNLGRITNQIRQKVLTVNNVRGVRSVAYGSSVLISVDLIDKNKAGSTKKAIQKAVKPIVNNKGVTVITDEGSFTRDRNDQTGVRTGTK